MTRLKLNSMFMPPRKIRQKDVLYRRLREMSKDGATLTLTDEEVQEVIKKAKSSKTTGRDGIKMLMLTHLGSAGVKYLIKVLNLSDCCLTTLHIRDKWKIGTVILLLNLIVR